MDIQIKVPDGKSGPWQVQTFTVTKDQADFENLRASFGRGRYIKEGTYKRLIRGSETIMSNTPAEIRDHMSCIWEAERRGGNILINGLGLGMVIQGMLDRLLQTGKPFHIYVVENSEDVICLTWPTYAENSNCTLIHSDALAYQPPKGIRYSVVWHDIWDNICSDNLEEMKTLHRKYGRRADWQGSWARALCERGYR